MAVCGNCEHTAHEGVCGVIEPEDMGGIGFGCGCVNCAHLFRRFRPWPIKHRWVCIGCGFVTRHYDGADRMAWRPVHTRMSVAYKGVNITKGFK